MTDLNTGKENGMNGSLSWVRLTAIFLLIAAAVSIACGQEAATPSPSVAIPQPAGADMATEGFPSTSESAPATLPSESRNFGGFNLSPASQTDTTESEATEGDATEGKGQLTVSATGSTTMAADDAYVVIIPEPGYSFPNPEPLSADDRSDIVEKLVELDIPEEAIDFDHRGRYGQNGVSVKLDPDEVEDLNDLSEKIRDVVKEEVRGLDAYGLRFTLSSESCDTALSEARQDAVPNAAKSASDLAEALGMERGAVIGAIENPTTNLSYLIPGSADANTCNSQASGPYYDDLLPFDAEPEVEVSVGLEVTYLMTQLAETP